MKRERHIDTLTDSDSFATAAAVADLPVDGLFSGVERIRHARFHITLAPAMQGGRRCVDNDRGNTWLEQRGLDGSAEGVSVRLALILCSSNGVINFPAIKR